MVQGSGFRVQVSSFRVQGSGFRVQGSGVGVQGSFFRAPPPTSSSEKLFLPELFQLGVDEGLSLKLVVRMHCSKFKSCDKLFPGTINSKGWVKASLCALRRARRSLGRARP